MEVSAEPEDVAIEVSGGSVDGDAQNGDLLARLSQQDYFNCSAILRYISGTKHSETFADLG
jgi:hypothetical protein